MVVAAAAVAAPVLVSPFLLLTGLMMSVSACCPLMRSVRHSTQVSRPVSAAAGKKPAGDADDEQKQRRMWLKFKTLLIVHAILEAYDIYGEAADTTGIVRSERHTADSL